MNVLDELREMVITTAKEKSDDARSAWMLVTDWLRLLDAFEAAHPGLVDHTIECGICGVPIDPRAPSLVSFVDPAWHLDIFCSDHELYDDLYCCHLCPACAKEHCG